MTPALLLNPTAAFLAGLVASVHCAGMCGPFACAILPAGRDDAAVVGGAYHAARIGAYGLLGAVAGGLGRLPLSLLPPAVLVYVPVATALLFLGLALRWDARWTKPFAFGHRIFGTVRALRQRSPLGAAALFGAATPLLPCGPLYFFFAVALLAGSAAQGAELMICFGIGTLPLLWLAQNQFVRLQARLPARWLTRVRVGLALAASAVAAWRIRFAGGAHTSCWLCF